MLKFYTMRNFLNYFHNNYKQIKTIVPNLEIFHQKCFLGVKTENNQIHFNLRLPKRNCN